MPTTCVGLYYSSHGCKKWVGRVWVPNLGLKLMIFLAVVQLSDPQIQVIADNLKWHPIEFWYTIKQKTTRLIQVIISINKFNIKHSQRVLFL